MTSEHYAPQDLLTLLYVFMWLRLSCNTTSTMEYFVVINWTGSAQVASYHHTTLEFIELQRATHAFTNVYRNSLHAGFLILYTCGWVSDWNNGWVNTFGIVEYKNCESLILAFCAHLYTCHAMRLFLRGFVYDNRCRRKHEELQKGCLVKL